MAGSKEAVNPCINFSTASLMPVASLMPTEAIRKIALHSGVNGLEVLPGKFVVYEAKSSHADKIFKPGDTFHESWKRDRSQEERIGIESTKQNLRISSVFPDEAITLPAVQKLEGLHESGVVFHWPEDTYRYNNPYLEAHEFVGIQKPGDKPWTPDQLITWQTAQPDKRKLVLDVSGRKLGNYLTAVGITDEQDQLAAIQQMLPHTGEVHFQVASKEEFSAVLKGNYDTQFGQFTRAVKSAGIPVFTLEVNAFDTMLKYFKVNPIAVWKKAVKYIQNA